MRTFEHGNWSNGSQCPICGTADDTEVMLIGILGTEEGNNMQAAQVHTKCLQENLRLKTSLILPLSRSETDSSKGIIYAICAFEHTKQSPDEIIPKS